MSGGNNPRPALLTEGEIDDTDNGATDAYGDGCAGYVFKTQAGAVGMMMMILIHQKCAAHAVVVKQLMLSLNKDIQLELRYHFHII